MAAVKKEDPRSVKMKTLVELLSKKFDDEKILERKGQGGKMFKYVKAQEYIVKMNEVFGVAWGAEVKEHFLVNNQIVMCVAITVTNPDNNDTYVRDGWGSHPLGQDVGNSFKSAYSKAFTKAASMVGAGLHLWGVDSDEDDAPTWTQAGGVPLPPTPPQAVVSAPGVPVGAPPPVPAPHGVVPDATTLPPAPAAVPPTFANTGAVPPPPPPAVAAVPPPPVPTGNPAPATAVATVPTGPAGQPVGPAVAAVGVQSAPPAAVNRIQDFQINGIVGAAVSLGMGNDPMQLVKQVLGEVGVSDIRELTLDQAQQVMDAVKSMPPQ